MRKTLRLDTTKLQAGHTAKKGGISNQASSVSGTSPCVHALATCFIDFNQVDVCTQLITNSSPAVTTPTCLLLLLPCFYNMQQMLRLETWCWTVSPNSSRYRVLWGGGAFILFRNKQAKPIKKRSGVTICRQIIYYSFLWLNLDGDSKYDTLCPIQTKQLRFLTGKIWTHHLKRLVLDLLFFYSVRRLNIIICHWPEWM